MAFPRIDHPEFAEFIRRFYGITQPEPTSHRQPPQDGTDLLATDSHVPATAEAVLDRKRPQRIGPNMEG